MFICTWQLTLTLAVRGQRSTRKRACCSTTKTEENKLERETGLLLRDFIFALDCEAFQQAGVVQPRLRGVILLVKVRLSQQSRRQAGLTHEQTLLTKKKSGECRLKWRGAQTTGRSGRVRSLSNQLQKSSSSGRKRVVHPNLNDLSVSLKRSHFIRDGWRFWAGSVGPSFLLFTPQPFSAFQTKLFFGSVFKGYKS